ncbi:MAG: hypothetical protein OQK24_08950 [Magnetovibrio sp.]|nr:hypothetical protein [Magnetovibrio sp.]
MAYTPANRIHKKDKTPEYDFGDDILYYQSSKTKSKPKTRPTAGLKRQEKDNDIKTLVLMCLFAFLILGSFVMIKMTPGMEFKISTFFSMAGMKERTGYQLGNVKLGTTMDVLRKDHPDAHKAMAANGAVTLSYNDTDGDYTVWYGEDGPYHIAYKARRNHTVTDLSEEEFVRNVSKRYGGPSVTSCNRRLTDAMQECQYSWWMPGELRLDMISRRDPSIPNADINVTMMATDTRLEGRIRRANLSTTIGNSNQY